MYICIFLCVCSHTYACHCRQPKYINIHMYACVSLIAFVVTSKFKNRRLKLSRSMRAKSTEATASPRIILIHNRSTKETVASNRCVH